VNTDTESSNYGRIRRIPEGERPDPSEVAITAAEAEILQRVAIDQRATALRAIRRERRREVPLRFHYRHRRKHH
jgi:hypothetical protein